jgi:uncharacterized phage protein (TIGR01671 family)
MNIRIYYKSPSTDEPNKIFVGKPISINELFFDRNPQIDFECGGYLMADEMDDGQIDFKLSSGLLAKNGEIYEGDIVRFVQKEGDEIIFQDVGIVKYHNAAFIVDGEPWDKDNHYLGDYVVEGNTTELEIIGNVFENEEIINGK